MRQTERNVSPMSNKGRNSYVVGHITAALLELLAEKELGAVSISELCEKAGVGRASFYRNYNTKEDILQAQIDKLFHEWAKSAQGIMLSEMIESLFLHFAENRAFYGLLNERGLIYLIKNSLLALCGPKPEQTKVEAYTAAFVAYTLYGWIEVWFARGMQETPQEMAEMFKNQGL